MTPSVRVTHRLMWAVAGTALLLAVSGCASGTPLASPGAGASEPASEPLGTTPSESRAPSTPATPGPPCYLIGPASVCAGEIPPGTYTSIKTQPQVTYTVPDGWQLYSDSPGEFVMLPPGLSYSDFNGVSDAIGIYSSVAALNRKCSNEAEAGSEEPGVAHTPQAIAAEFASRPGLTTTTPTPVSVGGLQGLVLNIGMAADWTGTCFYSDGGPAVQLTLGLPPTEIAFSCCPPGYVIRLYLLGWNGGTLAIEVDDASDGAHLDAYSAMVDQFRFGS